MNGGRADLIKGPSDKVVQKMSHRPDQKKQTPTEVAKFDIESMKSFFKIRSHKDAMDRSQRHLESTETNNEFLSNIIDDYRAFNSLVEQSAAEKIEVLRTVSDFVEKLKKERKLTNTELERAVSKQRDILRQIEDLRRSIRRTDR
jgi:hypothetical protein